MINASIIRKRIVFHMNKRRINRIFAKSGLISAGFMLLLQVISTDSFQLKNIVTETYIVIEPFSLIVQTTLSSLLSMSWL